MIINTNELTKAFATLGWDNLSPSEVAEWLDETGINPAGVLAFCNALIASPAGLDVKSVVDLSGGEQPYVVEFFQGKGVVI